jgi:predicted ATPase
MHPIRAALAACLLLAGPALAQSQATTEAMRALREAESELRSVLTRMEEGSLPGSMAQSRLRQALNEVERAMLRLPAESRRGPTWQNAVRELTEAIAATREDGADIATARQAAGEALATLPALRGEETGSGGS